MAKVRVNDLELHVEERGEGPVLLLIAGIPAVASDWTPVAEGLSATRRVIAYDNRGSGASTATPGPYTTTQLASDATGLLDRMEIAKADVFGMSLGGMIAQELALGWPDRVERLILGCTHAGLRHAARQPRDTGRAFALQTDDWALRMRTLAPFAFSERVDPKLLEAFIDKKAADAQDPIGYRAQIQAVLTHDSYDRLPQIAAATLIITGDDDRVIPGPSSRILHERIPGSVLRVIPGAGHLFFLEKPSETFGVLNDFLALP